MNLKSSILFVITALAMISCDKTRVFDEYKTVGETWKKDSIVTFKFKQTDTSKKYNLFVNVRNNNDYPFNNLFLIVSMQRPGGMQKTDTLQYQMTNPDGTLLGEGFTDVKDNKLFYKENLRFEKPGDYTVRVQHAMRQTGKVAGVSELKGVTEVGFRIESVE